MTKRMMLAAALAFAVGACDEGGSTAAKPAAAPAVPAAVAKKEADAKAAAEKREAERAAAIAALNVFPSEAEFVAACTKANATFPAGVCECAGKATVASLGAQGLYSWVWEGYINRNSAAQSRALSYFTKNNVDDKTREKYLKGVTSCYAM